MQRWYPSVIKEAEEQTSPAHYSAHQRTVSEGKDWRVVSQHPASAWVLKCLCPGYHRDMAWQQHQFERGGAPGLLGVQNRPGSRCHRESSRRRSLPSHQGWVVSGSGGEGTAVYTWHRAALYFPSSLLPAQRIPSTFLHCCIYSPQSKF